LAAALDQCAYREPAEVSERRLENIMAIRNAILAACASTMALVVTTGAFAQSGNKRLPGSDVGAFEGKPAPGRLRPQPGAGTAQPSISDQAAAGNLTSYRALPKPRAGLPDRTKVRAFPDGNASVGTRRVGVQAGDYDGDGRSDGLRTRGRHSTATVRGLRLERPATAPAAQTTGASGGRLRLETVGSPLR
jgi:hypothetical protein